MNGCQRLVGDQDTEAKKLDLSFARLASEQRIESIQTLILSFGIDLSENGGEEKLQATQSVLKLFGVFDARPGWQSSQDRSQATTRKFLGSRCHRASHLPENRDEQAEIGSGMLLANARNPAMPNSISLLDMGLTK